MQSQHADCSRLKLSVMYFISSSFFFFFLLEMWQHLLCHENDSKLRVVDWIAFGIVGICSYDLHSSLYSCLFGTAPLTPRDKTMKCAFLILRTHITCVMHLLYVGFLSRLCSSIIARCMFSIARCVLLLLVDQLTRAPSSHPSTLHFFKY